MCKKITVLFVMGIYIKAVYSQPQLVWSKTYWCPIAYDMICDKNGYIYFTGTDMENVYTVKISPQGNILWQSKVDLIPNSMDWGMTMVLNEEENILYVAGGGGIDINFFDLYVLKYNANTGDTIWVKSFDLYADDIARDMEFWNDKIVIAGHSPDFLGNEIVYPFICIIDTNGNLITYQFYGFSTAASAFWNIKPYVNKFYLCGKLYDYYTNFAGFLTCKIDNSLNVIWAKDTLIIVPFQMLDGGEELDILNTSGEIVVNGILSENNSIRSHWVVFKYDTLGNLIWKKDFGRGQGYGCKVDLFASNIFLCGRSLTGSFQILYLTPSGDTLWSQLAFPNATPQSIRNYCFRVTGNADSLFFYVIGELDSDSVIINKYFYGCTECETQVQEKEPKNLPLLYKVPNLFHNSTLFIDKNFYLYDVTGKKLKGMNKKGIYFLKNKEENKKFKIVKF